MKEVKKQFIIVASIFFKKMIPIWNQHSFLSKILRNLSHFTLGLSIVRTMAYKPFSSFPFWRFVSYTKMLCPLSPLVVTATYYIPLSSGPASFDLPELIVDLTGCKIIYGDDFFHVIICLKV